jgi:hypothetical protein
LQWLQLLYRAITSSATPTTTRAGTTASADKTVPATNRTTVAVSEATFKTVTV